ncbi:MAG: Abi family protein [Lancefieldella parvula]|uniref:Abi family protein n=1 Tax=Lancefieldella parvula TaxID=1382 RepID=A0A9E7AF73_9ACTN|nr:MAG: Abi family protein [Lancefieldella parvula]
MKNFKTYNQQLRILRNRGLIVPKDGSPKRFLEQENYYNVINGYKDLFLQKDLSGALIVPECFLPNTHFNELKALFLFDRELRILFLEYILIFENTFKTVISHEFSRKYPSPNSYLEIKNYDKNNSKKVLLQIAILTKMIHEKVDQDGAINHYITNHGSVPLWVLVNYLTMGNLAHLYSILIDQDKNNIAKFYSNKYKTQYEPVITYRLSSEDLTAALKILNLIRNKCAHDERLYNSNFKSVDVSNIANYFNYKIYNNQKIIVAIIYLKFLLEKRYFRKFISELNKIFEKYRNQFKTVKFSNVLDAMGINEKDLQNFI